MLLKDGVHQRDIHGNKHLWLLADDLDSDYNLACGCLEGKAIQGDSFRVSCQLSDLVIMRRTNSQMSITYHPWGATLAWAPSAVDSMSCAK